jgi:hypothetical protein
MLCTFIPPPVAHVAIERKERWGGGLGVGSNQHRKLHRNADTIRKTHTHKKKHVTSCERPVCSDPAAVGKQAQQRWPTKRRASSQLLGRRVVDESRALGKVLKVERLSTLRFGG